MPHIQPEPANQPAQPAQPAQPDSPHQTLRQALAHAQQQGLERLEAQRLLLHVLGRSIDERAWLIAHDCEPVPTAAHRAFRTLCQRRQQGEPLAYLTGYKAFYGLLLQVDARVLDPRPDTEILVDWALALCADFVPDAASSIRIADLGTGSGAVALAIKSQWPAAQVWAADCSSDALHVAQANAQRLALAVQFVCGDWLENVPGALNLIVSNPPYIAQGDPHLAALRHEPLSALVSGADGLQDLARIAAQAPSRLAPGGWLLLEHGFDQGAAVRALLQTQGFTQVQSRIDWAGHERCTGGQIKSLK
jgi:release factor glutamine methyltransferase